MKEFSCGDVLPGCTAKFRADSNQEILEQVAKHARDSHGLADVSSELVEAVLSHIRIAPNA